ncbi:MAG: nitroreductase family protein [Spirochaetales bacterium]|nr:nitroreductase family protein [Spirochaetales bacterium]
MDVREAMLKRRSIREFNDKPLPDESIRELLQSAMAAPSAHNRQPWEFYVVKNRPLQERLRRVSRYSNMNSSLIIIVAGNQQRFMAPPASDFWVQDCSAAVENLLLSATSLGIASCWCGLFPSSGASGKVREILGLEGHIIPMALIHLGYSDLVAAPRTQYDEARVHLIGETGQTPE